MHWKLHSDWVKLLLYSNFETCFELELVGTSLLCKCLLHTRSRGSEINFGSRLCWRMRNILDLGQRRVCGKQRKGNIFRSWVAACYVLCCVFLASHPSSSSFSAAAAYVPTDLCLFIFHLITGRSEAIIHGLCKPPLIHPIQSAIDNALAPCTSRCMVTGASMSYRSPYN